MSRAAQGVLELLLPELAEPQLGQARRLTTFLRLLSNDASSRRAARVGLVLEQARAEFERDRRERILAALVDLLARHLGAARSADAFLSLPESRQGLQAAWGLLAEERAEHPWLAGVPQPGEGPLDVVGRLLACARRLGLEAGELRLWEARRTALQSGARAGERAFAELLSAGGGAPALCGLVECLLERGAVRAAGTALAERCPQGPVPPELARLRSWVALLAEDAKPARAIAPARRLPAALVDLRSERGEWTAHLAGRAARGTARRFGLRAGRAEVGAACLAVYRLDERGLAHLCAGECAPAWRANFSDWCAARADSLRESGEYEHSALVGARPWVALARPGECLRGAQDPAATRAVAVVPVGERDGEPIGWLRLEFEHLLVPSRRALIEFARSWREAVLLARAPERGPAAGRALPLVESPAGREDLRSELLRALVGDLGLKTAQRRWWGLVPDPDGAQLLCEGGGALADWRRRVGGGRALRRTLSTHGSTCFQEPDAQLALCADSRSGAVLPLRHGSRLVAVLVVESTRRRDLRELEQGLVRSTRPWAAELRVAAFRSWHREHFGIDPLFDVGVAATRAWVELLLAAARARSPVALCGARGTGKRVLARWLHFESPFSGGPLRMQSGAECDGNPQPGARAGTLYLSDIERLAAREQLRLEAALAAGPGPDGARLVVGSTCALAEAGLYGPLARRLERLELFVPTLAERRDELPLLIAAIAARFARELGRAEPELSDEVHACLWRQPWRGNLRELENLLYRLVLCAPRGRIELGDLQAVARRFRFELLARVSSREADPQRVASALHVTRNQCGSENKTRAALYLGWDPDTLTRVRAELGSGAAAARSRNKKGRPVVPPGTPSPNLPGLGDRPSPCGPPGH